MKVHKSKKMHNKMGRSGQERLENGWIYRRRCVYWDCSLRYIEKIEVLSVQMYSHWLWYSECIDSWGQWITQRNEEEEERKFDIVRDHLFYYFPALPWERKVKESIGSKYRHQKIVFFTRFRHRGNVCGWSGRCLMFVCVE